MPKPVFTSNLEYESLKDKPKLDQALRELTREDSSLLVKEDEETGQLLISGLGELHLEIIKDRLNLDYGLKVNLGKFRVAYRESVSNRYKKRLEYINLNIIEIFVLKNLIKFIYNIFLIKNQKNCQWKALVCGFRIRNRSKK